MDFRVDDKTVEFFATPQGKEALSKCMVFSIRQEVQIEEPPSAPPETPPLLKHTPKPPELRPLSRWERFWLWITSRSTGGEAKIISRRGEDAVEASKDGDRLQGPS